MRFTLVLFLLAACAHAPSPEPLAAPRPVAPPLVAAPPPLPSEAEVIERSHALLLAYDRGDVDTVDATLAPQFLHFEGDEPHDRDLELATMRKRKPGGQFIAERVWDEEHVHLHRDGAVFLGKASEVEGGNTSKGGFKHVGWYVLQWVRVHAEPRDEWRLALWTWQRGGEPSMRDSWNDVYRNGVGFAKEPNRLLVETMYGRRPGAALDVAMGQGRNALFLSSLGWKVTGIDISDEAIRLAREGAKKRKLALDAVNTNIETYDFGVNRWDLVTMIYATSNAKWIERIKPSLKPGGLFVLEFFFNDGTEEGGFTSGELAKLFAGFEILRDQVVEDVPDWARDRAQLVRFVARRR